MMEMLILFAMHIFLWKKVVATATASLQLMSIKISIQGLYAQVIISTQQTTAIWHINKPHFALPQVNSTQQTLAED